ncbi:MAG: FtsW/RodA/SpoVE family cell cycle protein [Erysipelotrichaceae bacterium]
MRQQLGRVKNPKSFDFLLIGILVFMALISFVAIYSAFPLLPNYVSGSSLLIKQAMWYGLGFATVGVIMYLGNESIYDAAKILYWILMGFLVLLFIDKYLFNKIPFIEAINGATSWFQFPGIGSFQPSEYMKIVLIVISAWVIQDHNKDKTDKSFETDLRLFGKILKWCVPPLALIVLQPDTGIPIIIVISISVMVMASGIRKEWIWIGLLLVTVAVATFFILFLYYPSVIDKLFGGSYKLSRIYGWLYPEKYMSSSGNQLYTALLALGSAGLQGAGIQNPAVYIPEAQTDFIFAVIGQSFGLIGTLTVIAACFALDLKLISIATTSKNQFEKYIVVGVLGMLFYQQLQNMGMIVGILPITGVTLPFISYGGSSLISYFLAIGIIMNTSAKAKKLSDYVYH